MATKPEELTKTPVDSVVAKHTALEEGVPVSNGATAQYDEGENNESSSRSLLLKICWPTKPGSTVRADPNGMLWVACTLGSNPLFSRFTKSVDGCRPAAFTGIVEIL